MEPMATRGAPLGVPTHHSSLFDIDDAFSDGDENTVSYKLSPAAIREDLAKNLGLTMEQTRAQAEDLAAPSGFYEVHRTSIPILDMGDTAQASRSESPSPNSQDDSGMSAHFSQISLSTSIHENGVFHDAGTKRSSDQDLENEDAHSYPNVIIDASKSPLHRVSLSTDLAKLDHTPDLQTTSSRPPSSDQAPPMLEPTQSLPTATRSLSATPIPHLPSNHASVSASSLIPTAPAFAPTSLPSSSSLPEARIQAPPKPPGHRPTRSTGPSALEKVRSKTRPSFLPPKPRQEDDKHMADWQSMMKLSRAAVEKRRKALQERRLAREQRIEDSLHLWEKEIVPNWKVVHKNPALRKLWWNGIPTKLRATMWERAVGNDLALSKDHYRTCLARAKRALTSGTFPQATLDLIEQDMSNTLPALHIFHQETGPLHGDLKEMLCAWVVSRSDEGLGYALGASKIAAMLLINMPVQQGFVVMRNLLERHCMRSFFGGERAKEDVDAYYRIFDTLLADGMPKIYFNFKQHQISPSAYLPDWLLPLFLDHLPLEACARVWDVLLLEGDSFLYRASLGILAVLEPRLFFPDRRELLDLLKGENKAALDVAVREGIPLDGGKYQIYGVDEETLWERIDSMDEWWKESTWTRLIQRELPDI